MHPESADWKTPARGARKSGGRGGGGRASARGKRAQEPGGGAERDLGPDADPESFARQILLRRLTDQPRSRSELAQALAKREVPDEVAARVLDRFEEVGLIDDEAFARSWVESRQRSRGLSSRALAQELRRKGIGDEDARGILDEIDPEDERELARALVHKKLRSVRGLDHQVQVRRLAGMLARKGYSGAMAFDVIREELQADSEDLQPLEDLDQR